MLSAATIRKLGLSLISVQSKYVSGYSPATAAAAPSLVPVLLDDDLLLPRSTGCFSGMVMVFLLSLGFANPCARHGGNHPHKSSASYGRLADIAPCAQANETHPGKSRCSYLLFTLFREGGLDRKRR